MTSPYAIRLARSARRTVRFNIALALGLRLVLAVGDIAGVVSLAFALLVGATSHTRRDCPDDGRV